MVLQITIISLPGTGGYGMEGTRDLNAFQDTMSQGLTYLQGLNPQSSTTHHHGGGPQLVVVIVVCGGGVVVVGRGNEQGLIASGTSWTVFFLVVHVMVGVTTINPGKQTDLTKDMRTNGCHKTIQVHEGLANDAFVLAIMMLVAHHSFQFKTHCRLSCVAVQVTLILCVSLKSK